MAIHPTEPTLRVEAPPMSLLKALTLLGLSEHWLIVRWIADGADPHCLPTSGLGVTRSLICRWLQAMATGDLAAARDVKALIPDQLCDAKTLAAWRTMLRRRP